MSRILQSV